MIYLFGVIVVAAILAAVFVARPAVIRSTEGKILAFAALFIAPGLAVYGGATAHLERSKSTSFCLSCHVMEPYGKSLLVDDQEHLPAAHYQNNRVPRDHACYSCHTDYAVFGGVRSKLRGLRHVLVQYTGSIPDTIRLYKPFHNRECLHCHQGARSFAEAAPHSDILPDLMSNKESCLQSGCHDVVHDVPSLKGAATWIPPRSQP